jgi:transcription termination factor NusB
MSELINFSRKYQRELAIINLFQIIFYKSEFVFEFLDNYFKNLLNRYIINKVDIDLKIWNIVRYTDFSILNELEKSLLILFFLETLYSGLDAKIILSIYVNLSIKYCRKNFNKLIPVFLDKIKNE